MLQRVIENFSSSLNECEQVNVKHLQTVFLINLFYNLPIKKQVLIDVVVFSLKLKNKTFLDTLYNYKNAHIIIVMVRIEECVSNFDTYVKLLIIAGLISKLDAI